MSTVVQTSYRPQIPFGIVGMPADGMPHADGTRVVETAAGIGFGLAVSQGTKEAGCILGGSSFVGLTVRDITLVRSPIDPLQDALAPLDVYPQFSNAGIRSRGRIWVRALSNVAPGDGLFYSTTTGGLSNSASGVSAQGSITFARQPADGDTVTIQGTAVTFKTSGATGAQVNIGMTLGDTVANLANFLSASADVNLVLLSYAAEPPTPVGGGSGANKILVASKLVGTAGNAYTLAATGGAATVSGATLSGGAASATAVTSGYWLSAAIAGQLAKVSLAIQR